MNFFLYQNEEQVGPYTEEQIAAMIAAGSITRDDNVWREGLVDWQPIHTVVNLPIPAIQGQIQPPLAAKPQISDTQSVRKLIKIPLWTIIAIPPVITLCLGYFIGREHLKYQLRSAFSDVATTFSQKLKNTTSAIRPSSVDDVDTTSASVPSPLGEIHTTAAPTPNPVPQLMLGETQASKGFTVKLDGAKIETAKIKDMMGGTRTGKSPNLILSFTFANIDDRRILRFHPSNQFMAGNFRLRDDVDNIIRSVNYGITSEPVGALTGSEDIAPNSSVTHVELFSIPPPKTEYLILTIDLACLGGEGKIEFKIPASSIVK